MQIRRLVPLLALLRLLPTAVAVATALAPAAACAGRSLAPEDWYRFQGVSELQIAPDGSAVAYLVTSYDKEADESRGALWMSDWTRGEGVQLTRGGSVSVPRFSPDGLYLSFLEEQPEGSTMQLWVLDRRGGEPRQLSHVSNVISDYAWSPDGTLVVLVMHATEDSRQAKGSSKPKPLVIDALQFKSETDGYLTAESRSHLFLLDVRGGTCQALTADPKRVDSLPTFSPDGQQIAYVSNKVGGQADLGIDEISLILPAAGAAPRRLLSTWSPNRQHLAWSPDGKLIALLRGDEPKYNAYIMDRLAVADIASAHLRPLTDSLDRAILSPRFSADGQTIQFAVEDDGSQYPAQVTLSTGAIEHLAGAMVVTELASAAGHTAVLVSSDTSPVEVYALELGRLRALSAHNRALFSELTLGSVEDIAFKSRDGTEIHGQLVKPPGFAPGRHYPAILWIHGGPNGQDDHSLELGGASPQLERQQFATRGYVVLSINYRGSTGRGAAFARSIAADWGHKEVEDLLAGVDYVTSRSIVDPARLGVGGWSYGGILTDYIIASDKRFKAAISGAGSGNQLATWGADEYFLQDSSELGMPWVRTDRWIKVSYPLFHADRIHTPTLFLGGEKDFNVPIAGSEQMYQSLRALGVPTQLIIYPGEYHVLAKPSYLVDRSQRFLEWMDKYLGATP